MATEHQGQRAEASCINIQSTAHEKLLNVIDDLRSQGISRFIDLPQLIVCGDQSSGKSSVLEAVSGIRFPTKDALCTRFATELILRRNPEISSIVTIVPDVNRSDEEKKQLEAFKCDTTINEDFGSIIEQAGKVMGLDGSVKNFGTDVLRVEVTGPSQPHLTLVDLPGLFHSGNKTQSDNDASAVRELVTGYMRKPRSIILAVVSAKNDFANQIVTKYAKEFDKGGVRTLGIITKPDTLHAGSESELQFFELAQNKDVQFRLGWHVLKNRDYDQRESTAAERDASEKEFFSTGIWSALGHNKVGINSLRPRLSEVLQSQILTELPSLLEDVHFTQKDCQARFDRLGPPRGTLAQQRVHLHSVSEGFTSILKDAIRGNYNHDFFGDPATDHGYSRRIRAVSNNILIQFAKDVRLKGHKYKVVGVPQDQDDSVTGKNSRMTPIQVSQKTRIQHVQDLICRNRGTELPGFFKEDTITTLFRDQCSPWADLVRNAAEDIFDAVKVGVLSILEAVCDEVTYGGILSSIVNPELDQIKVGFDIAVERTLEQHIKGHPITFNHYFTDNVQKLRNAHNAEHMARILEGFFGVNPNSENPIYNSAVNTKVLLKAISAPTEADMNQFACSEALHFMEAYYKVAMKYFTDDFAIAAVEQGLLRKLDSIFSPVQMFSLSDVMVEDIAGETEESKVERAACAKKLEALKKALDVLNKLDRGTGRTSLAAKFEHTEVKVGGEGPPLSAAELQEPEHELEPEPEHKPEPTPLLIGDEDDERCIDLWAAPVRKKKKARKGTGISFFE